MSSPVFAPLAIGGGGWVTGLDVNSDGTLACRTDTCGAYSGNVTAGTRWQPVVNFASMPLHSVGIDANGNFAPTIGVYEIRIAPSNSSVWYMMYSDDVSQLSVSLFKSTNKGATWTKLANFSALNITWGFHSGSPDFLINENDGYRMCSQKMAIHPTDPNTVLVGTPKDGLFYTTDGGGSFNPVSSVPAGIGDSNSPGATQSPQLFPGISGICFDPATPTTIYAASFGNGVYKTTTGVNGTWSHLSSSPNFVTSAAVSAGNYWCVGRASSSGIVNGQLGNTLFNAAFSTALSDTNNGLQSLCFVSTAIIVVTTAGGQLHVSIDTGATWDAAGGQAGNGPSFGMPFTSADVPWLAHTPGSFSAGALVADPITSGASGRIIQSIGTGVITVAMAWSSYNFLSTNPWVSQTAGIEQLVARKVISPPGGKPIVAVEDFGCFYIDDPAVFPLNYSTQPLAGATTCASYDVDYAKSLPSTVGEASMSFNPDVSGLSTSGGQAGTWGQFLHSPNPLNHRNGNIALSTPLNILYFNPYDEPAPFYTIDGGASAWTASTGLPTSGWAVGTSFANAKLICADDAGNGTFYALNSNTNIYRSTNNGASFSSILTGCTFNSFYEPMIVSVPGKAGHIFAAPGIAQSANLPVGNALYRSQNANGGSPTLTTVSNVQDVWAIGFGAIVSGQSYPAVFIVGFVKVGAAPYVYGLWASKDNCVSWTLLTQYPFNSADQIVWISGDNNDPTICYFGFQGSGAGYGRKLVY